MSISELPGNLPVELWSEIVLYLPKEDVESCCQVSQKFRDVAIGITGSVAKQALNTFKTWLTDTMRMSSNLYEKDIKILEKTNILNLKIQEECNEIESFIDNVKCDEEEMQSLKTTIFHLKMKAIELKYILRRFKITYCIFRYFPDANLKMFSKNIRFGEYFNNVFTEILNQYFESIQLIENKTIYFIKEKLDMLINAECFGLVETLLDIKYCELDDFDKDKIVNAMIRSDNMNSYDLLFDIISSFKDKRYILNAVDSLLKTDVLKENFSLLFTFINTFEQDFKERCVRTLCVSEIPEEKFSFILEFINTLEKDFKERCMIILCGEKIPEEKIARLLELVKPFTKKSREKIFKKICYPEKKILREFTDPLHGQVSLKHLSAVLECTQDFEESFRAEIISNLRVAGALDEHIARCFEEIKNFEDNYQARILFTLSHTGLPEKYISAVFHFIKNFREPLVAVMILPGLCYKGVPEQHVGAVFDLIKNFKEKHKTAILTMLCMGGLSEKYIPAIFKIIKNFKKEHKIMVVAMLCYAGLPEKYTEKVFAMVKDISKERDIAEIFEYLYKHRPTIEMAEKIFTFVKDFKSEEYQVRVIENLCKSSLSTEFAERIFSLIKYERYQVDVFYKFYKAGLAAKVIGKVLEKIQDFKEEQYKAEILKTVCNLSLSSEHVLKVLELVKIIDKEYSQKTIIDKLCKNSDLSIDHLKEIFEIASSMKSSDPSEKIVHALGKCGVPIEFIPNLLQHVSDHGPSDEKKMINILKVLCTAEERILHVSEFIKTSKNEQLSQIFTKALDKVFRDKEFKYTGEYLKFWYKHVMPQASKTACSKVFDTVRWCIKCDRHSEKDAAVILEIQVSQPEFMKKELTFVIEQTKKLKPLHGIKVLQALIANGVPFEKIREIVVGYPLGAKVEILKSFAEVTDDTDFLRLTMMELIGNRGELTEEILGVHVNRKNNFLEDNIII